LAVLKTQWPPSCPGLASGPPSCAVLASILARLGAILSHLDLQLEPFWNYLGRLEGSMANKTRSRRFNINLERPSWSPKRKMSQNHRTLTHFQHIMLYNNIASKPPRGRPRRKKSPDCDTVARFYKSGNIVRRYFDFFKDVRSALLVFMTPKMEFQQN